MTVTVRVVRLVVSCIRCIRPVLLLSTFALPLLAQGSSRTVPPAVLPTVTLRDQFDVVTPLSAQAGRPVVVLVSGRAGKDAAARWHRRLQDIGAMSGVQVVSVADVAGAPRLLRGVIRRAMPSDTAARVLLDWEGALARRVRGDVAPLVAAAYGMDGQLKHWESLSLEREDAAIAQRLIAGLRGP